MNKSLLSFVSLLLLSSMLPMSAGQAPLGKSLGNTSQVRGVNATDNQVVAALNEALTAGVARAIQLAGTENGFWANESIRIPLPDQMQALEKGLRMMGNGLKLQEFQLSMNRAAEGAAKNGATIFDKSLNELTFQNPKTILNGNDSAATEYFATQKASDLKKALAPIVEAEMGKAGVTDKYNSLSGQMKGLTMGRATTINVTSYVVQKTLDGILALVAAQEAQLRSAPQLETSPLLKQVFTKS